MAKKKVYGVSNTCFQLVIDSEGVEGEDTKMFTAYNTETSDRDVLPEITKETVVAFLDCDETEVYIVPVENGHYDMVAYNSVSKEAIRINKIGHHFVALIETVKAAKDKIEERKENPNCNILTHRFIKKINEQLMIARYGEIAIGEYRTIDFVGRDVEVILGRFDEYGNKKRIECVNIETSKDKNVIKKMDELVKWTNETFKSEVTLQDIAEFHARFIKIHPFRDGNGRTARLLTNYLFVVAGYPMINIPPERKKEYYQCLNYANTHDDKLFIEDLPENKLFYEAMTKMYGKRTEETKYLPLTRYLKSCFMKENSKSLINNVINYRKEGAEKSKMNVSEILSPYYRTK